MATIFSYPHIEDYIEIISGHRKPDGSTLALFEPCEPLLSLARYDVNIIESLATQTLSGTSYTDRQAALCKDIVLKYERQLAKHSISIEGVKEKPEFRNTIRTIDRSTSVWIEDDKIYIRFPYDNVTIESIRSASKESQGSIKFNRDKRVWEADLTESNVNWVYAFAEVHRFKIESSMQTVMEQILATEKTTFTIELRAGDQLSITNAPDTLSTYISEKLGGFAFENLLKLVDYAPLLGYTVEPVIEQTVIEAFGPRFYSLCSNRELKVDLNNTMGDQVDALVAYARETNRFPIVVYEPDQSDRLTMLFMRHFNKDEVVDLDNDKVGAINTNTKFVFVRKIPRDTMPNLPLLVSSAGMMFGGDRQIWLQTAEKIVYFTKDVYNKTNRKGKDVCKLN